MKFAPKSFMILCILSLLWSCRSENNKLQTPKNDSNIDIPREQLKDSSKLNNPKLEFVPDSSPAKKKAKKKSSYQLDTLRAIKA